MSLQRRLGGLPLAVYVVALLLLPLTAVGLFSVRELDRNEDAASRAAAVSRLTGSATLAARAVVPAEAELIATLSVLDGRRLSDFDARDVLASTVPDLDATLDELERSLSASDDDDASTLQALASARTRLDGERAGIDTGASSASGMTAASGALVTVLTDIVRHADRASELIDVDDRAAISSVRELPFLTTVLLTAQQEFHTIASDLLDVDAASSRALVAADVRHSDALIAATFLDPTAIAVLREQRVAPPGAVDVGPALASRLAYATQVSEFTGSRRADVQRSIELRALDVRSLNESTLLLLAVVAAWSILFGIVVMRSFAGPLTRLRLQAERISAGELTADPLPVAGPSDVRKVTDAVNEMAGTLSLVEAHMNAIALAELSRVPDLDVLPGHVGASMRRSMERVVALTSRLKSSEARLAQEARVDHLTSLPNRFAVLEHLDRLTRESARGADGAPARSTGVMFLDVDGFKSVNDTHGHAVGDVVLREIAQRLSRSIREIDLVARLGGDEFLVIVADIADPERLIAFGQRMITEVEQPYTVGEQLFAVSASVGVTMIAPGDTAMAVIARADAAVYQAKRHGRRRVEFFDLELQLAIEHQAETELALRQAIQHDELRMYLQPLSDLSTGRCSGAEALVRWERPGHGMISASDFIPIAERSGLIFELERWMLDAACRRVAEWRITGRGDGMRLAVNISGRHLVEGDLLGDIDTAIASTGADPNLLEIELTESHLLDDVDRASAVLAAVRERGIKVAIDDFGTGYSSMTYLQRLPVDIVKIDQSFVASATTNAFDATIIDTIVTIGRALSLDVVAEGIETSDQLACVTAAGVTHGQGFLLCRPLPADEAEAVMFGSTMFDPSTISDRDAAVAVDGRRSPR